MIEASEITGSRLGVVATDSALRVAAAEGGLGVALVDREALRSCVLFFLDLLGPAVERLDVLDLTSGLIGDDSLEGTGEVVADVWRFVWSFFTVGVDVDGVDDVDNSGTSLDCVETGRTMGAFVILS